MILNPDRCGRLYYSWKKRDNTSENANTTTYWKPKEY